MSLTNYALEKMGFELIPPDVTIEANFRSLNVYEVQGIVSDKKSPLDPAALMRKDIEVSFSLGDSVNEICRLLTDDDFADDEDKWRSESKSTPPYLIVLSEFPEKAICSHGYWQHANDEIVTHDCFTEAKEALQKLENQKTAVVVAALSALLSNDQKPVVFAGSRNGVGPS